MECAAYLLNRLPTKPVLGYMSPYECVYGAAPDSKWIRIWGCKCYALKPKADRRKDFDEKAYIGFLVGYRVFGFCSCTRQNCCVCGSTIERTITVIIRSWLELSGSACNRDSCREADASLSGITTLD